MEWILISLAISISYILMAKPFKSSIGSSELAYWKFKAENPLYMTESERLYEKMKEEAAYKKSIFNKDNWTHKPSPIDGLFDAMIKQWEQEKETKKTEDENKPE